MPAVENGDNVFSPISPGSPSLNSSMGTAGGSKVLEGTVTSESKVGGRKVQEGNRRRPG